MSDDKSTAGNMLDSAKAKVNEGADRARAAGHDLASKVGGSSLENAGDKAQGVKDRAKAEVHNAEANASYNEGKKEAKDGDGH